MAYRISQLTCTPKLVKIVDPSDSSSDIEVLETPLLKQEAAKLKCYQKTALTPTLKPLSIAGSTTKLAALQFRYPVKSIKSEVSDSQLTSPAVALPSAKIPSFAHPGCKSAFLPIAYAKLGSSTNLFQAFSKGPHVVKDLQGLVDLVYEG